MPEFELVLPCYNESKSIQTLIERAVAAAEEYGYRPDTFQLVLVENGSRDDSSKVIDQLKQTTLGRWFRKVQVIENQGYGYGVWTGLANTKASVVGWSHADQQCDPKDAFRAINLMRKSGDKTLVKGARFGRDWKDKFVTRVFEILSYMILGLKIREINAQPKIFHRLLLEQIKSPPKNFAFDLYVIYIAARCGFRFETIDVEFPPRVHGVSNWASTFLERYKTIFNMMRYIWTLSRTEGRL